MSWHEELHARAAVRRAQRHAALAARLGGTGPGRPGRPRSESAERAIIDATLDVLATDGVAGVSIEGVAAKAGVGKTTIYRRWPNKEALICEAAASLKQPPPELPGESVRDDLVLLGRAMLANRTAGRAGRVHACLMMEAHRHPELAKLYRETVIEPRRDLVRAVLRRGVETGELRADIDIETMLMLISGALLARTLPTSLADTEPPEDLAETMVDAALTGLRPR